MPLYDERGGTRDIGGFFKRRCLFGWTWLQNVCFAGCVDAWIGEILTLERVGDDFGRVGRVYYLKNDIGGLNHHSTGWAVWRPVAQTYAYCEHVTLPELVGILLRTVEGPKTLLLGKGRVRRTGFPAHRVGGGLPANSSWASHIPMRMCGCGEKTRMHY